MVIVLLKHCGRSQPHLFTAQSVCTCVGGRTEDSARGRTFLILLTYLGSPLVRRHLGVKQLLISTFQRVENGHRHRALGTH